MTDNAKKLFNRVFCVAYNLAKTVGYYPEKYDAAIAYHLSDKHILPESIFWYCNFVIDYDGYFSEFELITEEIKSDPLYDDFLKLLAIIRYGDKAAVDMLSTVIPNPIDMNVLSRRRRDRWLGRHSKDSAFATFRSAIIDKDDSYLSYDELPWYHLADKMSPEELADRYGYTVKNRP